MPQQYDSNFLKIFHNNLVGMVLTDDQHLITDINDQVLTLIGLKKEDVIGRTALAAGILNEDNIQEMWKQLAEKGEIINAELAFRTKHNKPLTLLLSTEKIHLNDAPCWLTSIIDISKKKQTEQALSDMYERIADGFISIDHNWCYRYVNKRAGELLGKDPAYLVGKHMWTEFPGASNNSFYKAYHRAMEKQETVTVEEYVEQYGRWFQNLIYPSADGLSIFFRDITSSKQIEREVEESELRFKTLARTAPVGIFETDAKGMTTFVNETWMAYSGMTFEEALGDGWLDAVHPEDREWLQKGWSNKTGAGAASTSEYRIVDKNGRQRWVNGKAVPVFNAAGAVTGYIGIILDVTERKESSEHMRELSRHLQKAREEERLNIAREIHDELGQQLTGLKMDVAWLMKKSDLEDIPVKTKFDDTLSLIDDTVKSIRRITSELRPSIIDDLGLNAAIEWHIAEFCDRLDTHIRYENNFNDKDMNPDISIGLFRILQESLTNIAKHAQATHATVTIGQQDNMVQLSVEDDGVGFDSSVKQTDMTFGLIGIRERTSMLKGHCDIFSKPGQGTVIQVNIPLG